MAHPDAQASAPPAATPSAAPARADFRYLERLRVRWAEVDLQKIVFNGHYLMYFDTAVGGYWRALALPYHDTMAGLGGDLYVRKASLDYLASARYDDVLSVGVRCARIGNSSMAFSVAVFRGAQCLVHGELLYVFADPETQRSRPVPAALRAWLQAYEAGEAMVESSIQPGPAAAAEWQALQSAVQAEAGQQPLGQPAPAAPAPAETLHLLLHNRAGLCVAGARLLPAVDGAAGIEGLVCRGALQGMGLGAQALQALIDSALARGDRLLQAQVPEAARSLFERAGFEAGGAGETDQASPTGVWMTRRLS